MGETNGVYRAADQGGAAPAVDREAVLRVAAWAFADHRPPLPTPEQVARFEAEVLRPVREWCAARADKVRTCHVAAVRRRIEAFVICHDPRFDLAFDNEAAALDLALFRAGWSVQVTTIPPENPDDPSDYFNPAEAVEVYANRRPAPAESRP